METYDEEIERLAMADADAQNEDWLSAQDCEKNDPMRWQQELTALGIERYMLQDRDYLD